MKVLSIDSSGEVACAAVCENQKIISQFSVSGIPQSETLLSVIDACLRCAKTSLEDIDKIAVAVGLGSFTGVRIGIALAKGLAIPRNIPIVPVHSLCFTSPPQGENIDRYIVIEYSRRDLYYYAEIKNGNIIRDGEGTMEEIETLNANSKIYKRNMNPACELALFAFEKEGVSANELKPYYLKNWGE